MMGRILTALALLIILLGCDSKLSDEQRKALREEMQDREIKRIGPNEIYNKALEMGKLLSTHLTNETNLDSIKMACACDVIFTNDKSELTEKEAEVFAAYQFDPTADGNLQKDKNEVLTYAFPQVASDSLEGVWFIRFKKSEIVRGL